MMGRKRVLFVGKGGKVSGMGHLVRIRTLLEYFGSRFGVSVAADTDRHGDGYLNQRHIEYMRFGNLKELSGLINNQGRYDMIIVDVYPPGKALISKMKRYCDVLVCFDDMKTLDHQKMAAVFICPQETFRKKIEYRENSVSIMGTDFFPVRRTILAARQKKKFNRQVKDVALLLGGVPDRNRLQEITPLIIESLGREIKLHVAGGYDRSSFGLQDHFHTVEQVTAIHDMGAFLQRMDMGIIAGGFLKFELMCVGIPFAMISLCTHQEELGRKFASEGFGKYLGSIGYCLKHPRRFQRKIKYFIEDESIRREIHSRSRKLVDGQGGERLRSVADNLIRGKRIS